MIFGQIEDKSKGMWEIVDSEELPRQPVRCMTSFNIVKLLPDISHCIYEVLFLEEDKDLFTKNHCETFLETQPRVRLMLSPRMTCV